MSLINNQGLITTAKKILKNLVFLLQLIILLLHFRFEAFDEKKFRNAALPKARNLLRNELFIGRRRDELCVGKMGWGFTFLSPSRLQPI